MSLEVTGARKVYAGGRARRRRSPAAATVALDGVELHSGDGELLVVMGPSGAGKTTLLRCVAGLEQLDHGRVYVAGEDVTGRPPGARNVSMVFQDNALYPHLSVGDNIAFGLRARNGKGRLTDERVSEVARSLGLDSALARRPAECSAGERQRAALARAMVREPALFLMDEPLSSLDPELRVQAREELRALQRRLGTTTLYVTHDPFEAMMLGDRVAVLRGGRVEQLDTPAALYDRPATAFVARLFGTPAMNVLPARALRTTPAGAESVGLRPERLQLQDAAAGLGRLAGRVVTVETTGADAVVHLDLEGARLVVRAPRGVRLPGPGTEIGVSFADEDVHYFDAAGRALR